ncbi:HPr family phosphocarrier protein [Deinococcus lacus]|uniref:HPr family phosphocarrier protein n=1 Tax=Deinococcus lacus TaxID=392561 RepID=A0ABW1YEN4_9DEIO
MLERSFKMVDPLGLHARPAGGLVKVAKPFQSDINLVTSEPVSLKSLIKVLSLGISAGTEFRIQTSGEDEAQAMEAVAAALVSEGLAEEI